MHVEGVLANNDYILNGCYIEITSNCNLRCIHCYNESGELRDQISVEAFKNVLGCLINPKKASITLSGGEPLLHPQVWKFIDMMLESGILARNILLITNATCITDDVANMLAEKHVSVQVSLNGSRAELHDSICGKGNFERTMAGLQRLLSKHANMVIVRNMMNKQNMNDNWDMFCEKLIDMGVHKIMLAGLKKVGRANENLEKIALTPLEYQSLIDRLKESKVITGINDEYRKLAGDEAESNIRIDIPVPYSGVCPYVYQDENPVPISPRIATNGDVYLCQSFMDQRYCLGNINKDSLPHALFNENFINLVNFMTTGRFYMDDCNKCVLKYQCPRGCIGDCLANGSIHETDGGCFFRKENAIRQLLKQSEAIAAEHSLAQPNGWWTMCGEIFTARDRKTASRKIWCDRRCTNRHRPHNLPRMPINKKGETSWKKWWKSARRFPTCLAAMRFPQKMPVIRRKKMLLAVKVTVFPPPR